MRTDRSRTGRVRATLATACACIAAPAALASPSTETSGRASSEPPPATARIVTDARRIAPGEPFFLGVEIRMRPSWHVYWKHPGDAGLSTELSFELPEGFRAGAVRYPVPERFVQPGDIVGYGYTSPVVLFAEITPPRSLPLGSSVTLGVEADWLACASVCIPGSASLETRLEVGETATRSLEGEAWVAALPMGGEGFRPFFDSYRAVKLDAERAAYEIELRWRMGPPREVDWLPATPPSVELNAVALSNAAQTTTIRFEAARRTGSELESDTMDTVVTYLDAKGSRRGVLVPIRLAMLARRERAP